MSARISLVSRVLSIASDLRIKAGEGAEELARGAVIGRRCSFRTVECPKVTDNTVLLDVSLVASGPSLQSDALISTPALRTLIARVLRERREPEIRALIVERVVILVVHELVGRRAHDLTRHVDQSM